LAAYVEVVVFGLIFFNTLLKVYMKKKSKPTGFFLRIWAALNQKDPWPYVFILVDASFWWRHVINISSFPCCSLISASVLSPCYRKQHSYKLRRFIFFKPLVAD